MSKIQQLTTKFEALSMKKDESISSYNNKIKDIANEFFSLGEPMTEDKLVRKVLRTLPLKFESKVTTIEEAQNLTKMKLDELMGSLITYEINIDGRIESKKQNIALKSQIKDSEEVSGENITLMVRKFNRVFGKLNKRGYEGKGLNSEGR
ncbi:hypothetical protein LIER_32053 [Lithospermum erythrorhizon]|uniref:Gag-pol polyprotein n=1 Tax=Lithospermum erythrorhizon TaxID=34254 RepID=A0AAV3RV86_LITER